MRDAPFRKLPPGSVDAHMHLYAPVPRRGAAPSAVPGAGLPGYRALMARLGISRVVLVQSIRYGTDNSLVLEGLRALGPAARGIAVTEADAPDALWDDLAAQGVVGLRAFMLKGGPYRWEQLPSLAERLAARGWQLHLQMDGRELVDRARLLGRLPCRLVIDHVGKFLEPVPPDHPAFRALLALVASGRTWVKLSGLYETSLSGPPEYADTAHLARQLADAAPARVLWATNWPHPNRQPPPDDRDLIELARRLVPDPARQLRLFALNAAELFGFASEAAAPATGRCE